jgi:hypothetical protein
MAAVACLPAAVVILVDAAATDAVVALVTPPCAVPYVELKHGRGVDRQGATGRGNDLRVVPAFIDGRRIAGLRSDLRAPVLAPVHFEIGCERRWQIGAAGGRRAGGGGCREAKKRARGGDNDAGHDAPCPRQKPRARYWPKMLCSIAPSAEGEIRDGALPPRNNCRNQRRFRCYSAIAAAAGGVWLPGGWGL